MVVIGATILMQILLVGLHRFTKPYGLCRYTANLFFCLRKVESLRVTLVLGEWQKDYYREALQMDVDDPNVIWVSLRRPALSRYWWYVWSLPKLARKLNASIVHILFPVLITRRSFACPIVLTMHDLYAYDTPDAIGFPNVFLNRLVLRTCVGASAAVVSISYFTRDRLRRWFPELEMRMTLPVIYQEVVVRETRSGTAQLMAIPAKFLLCVGHHRRNKNLDLTIEAFFKARDRGVVDDSTQLVIVGSEGPETHQLRTTAGRRQGVCFLNSIADEHLARLYTSCEALICASSIEGFCLPVAEALLFSCRVICSNIPVLREVAGDQGTYFGLEPRSSDAIVEAISSSMSSNSHTAGQSRLFTSNPAEEWPKLYAGVLEGHFESRAIKPKMVSSSSES